MCKLKIIHFSSGIGVVSKAVLALIYKVASPPLPVAPVCPGGPAGPAGPVAPVEPGDPGNPVAPVPPTNKITLHQILEVQPLLYYQ